MEMEDVDALLRDIDAYTSSRKKPDPQGPPLGRQTSTLGEQFVLAYPIQAPMLAQAGAHTQPIEYNSRAFHLTETQSSNWKDLPLDAYDRALLAEPYDEGKSLAVHGLTGQSQPFLSTLGSHPSRLTLFQRPSLSLDSSSSPLTHGYSSPSFGASQRRTIQDSHRGEAGPVRGQARCHFPSLDLRYLEVRPENVDLGHAPPMVQGIQLISSSQLPDRFRSVFPFLLFNAVQSKCFEAIYKTNDNLVLSAPTGSGKTAVLEMAICRLVAGFKTDQYKVVYMAPTKSLCSERCRDWQAKFAALDLQCAELTGDTDQAQLRNVQNANIIITTPEKWDSITRKWKDHSKLMQLVKLFLIDEVHILGDTRGATLEAVVSRMKSVGSNVRFVALSATVPNSDDIATWLGKDSTAQHLPAVQEKFGEEFRPVKLQKFVYGFACNGNDFVFEKVLDSKLPDIIAKHSRKKPIMVFCFTRKSTVSTAKALSSLWATKTPRDRQWSAPTQRIAVEDLDLRNTLTSGVAFHHGGLDGQDRHAVEKGFLDGQISVICCTSTLAVGVNLPCHLVIIKNTVGWQTEGIKEYADLEVMQMLGRAGRPQFDDSAIAVILTRSDNVKKYEKMVSGEELLESSLHLNLVDHLNAEIGLGTVNDLHTAKRWLAGTFLYVRLGQNPNHYKLDGNTVGRNLDDRIEQICVRDIGLLQETNLITSSGKLNGTEFGEAMARYYVRFETMKILLSLEPRAKMSEILSALVQAEEFHELRLRVGEKNLYKEFNNAPGIKFPIKVNIALPEHKRSLIIQAELAGIEFPAAEQFAKHKRQFQQDKAILFSHAHRLIRCVVDCQLYLQDSVTTRHALELARSFGARVWDNSPLQMKQIPQIGAVAVRKLAVAGINSIEILEATEAHRLEMLLNKQTPFGMRILAGLKDFPKLKVSVKMMGKDCRSGQPVRIKLVAEIGFINDKAPIFFHRKPIFVCFLAERSDGHLVDFRRVSAKKLGNGQDILISADLLSETQYITCYVMCDEIAGTMRYAELKPGLSASVFPPPLVPQVEEQPTNGEVENARSGAGFPRRRSPIEVHIGAQLLDRDDEFEDEGLNDMEFRKAADEVEFNDIDAYDARRPKHELFKQKTAISEDSGMKWKPEKLRNGRWACNHKCKDKIGCKHICCHEGLDKAPKPPKISMGPAASREANANESKKTTPATTVTAHSNLFLERNVNNEQTSGVATIDLAHGNDRAEYAKNGRSNYQKLHQLHESVTQVSPARVIAYQKPTFSYTKGDRPRIDFLGVATEAHGRTENFSSDYDIAWMDDLPSPSALIASESRVQSPVGSVKEPVATTSYDDDYSSELEAGMVGLDDSMTLSEWTSNNATDSLPPGLRQAYDVEVLEDDIENDFLATSMARTHRRRLSSTPPGVGGSYGTKHGEDANVTSTERFEKTTLTDTYNDQVKRKAIEIQQENGVSFCSLIAKKQKTRMDADKKPLLLSMKVGIQAAVVPMSTGDEIPRGFEDVDPDILAMFKDVVDFRKSEGLKLGQVIAKDLLKRIPPGSGHKAALRDPHVEIDVSGRNLTDEGLLEIANALTKSAVFHDEHGKVVVLEELGLKGNQLTAGSLWALSRVVALSTHALRDLDLSDNLISIVTIEETAAWEVFLESFSACCALRRIDLSGNPLGPQAFEILARVYGKEEPIDLLSLSDLKLNRNDFTVDLTYAIGGSISLEQSMRRMSMVLDDHSNDTEVASETAGDRRKGPRQDAQYPDKQPSVDVPETSFQIYESTRGLRSVPYIVFGNTTMTEACALHLSYVVVSHNFPEQLVARVPPAKAGPPQHQLEVYDNASGCRGLIYLPNDKLGSAGSRVLELAELAREGILAEAYQEVTHEDLKSPTIPASALRRVSDVRPSPSFSATPGRRRSATSATGSEHGARNASSGTASTELDRARSRIQGNVLRDFGAPSVDLWRASLKMLTLSRAILLSAAEMIRHEHVKEVESYQIIQSPPPAQPIRPTQLLVQPLWPAFQTETADNAFPPLPSSAMRAGMAPPRHSEPTPLKAGNPNHPVTPRHVHRRKKSVNPKAHLSGVEPFACADTNVLAPRAAKATSEQQPYRSGLPYGFSEYVWMQIISNMGGAGGIVNITQQRSILRWAMDRTTLVRERETLGKPESAQIWRLLEGIGCLAYDVRA